MFNFRVSSILIFMKKNTYLIFIALVFQLLFACSYNNGRYQQESDSTPTRVPTVLELKDAIARAEPLSKGGNQNYQVRGKYYDVLSNAIGFEQNGTASWYGKKFHGHLTSNGEIYDMYSMSAAHKNLPLPTYLKVTNLANQKSVIVRVNDRGPFHQSRIIDLSYSAAYKLDMLKTGTAKVRIAAITDFSGKNKYTNQTFKSTNKTDIDKKQTGIFIQVFATSKLSVAQKTAATLSLEYKQKVIYPKHQGIYRVQIGPLKSSSITSQLLKKLKLSGYPNAYRRNL